MRRKYAAMLLCTAVFLNGCGVVSMTPSANLKSTETEESGMKTETTENVIYLAGGCFWGMEQLMQSIPGVIDAESGYANGTCEEDADYRTVCKGGTGFRETVRVE